jgi:hypothetical protein
MSTSGFPWDRALRRHAAREQAEREMQELADQAASGLPAPSPMPIAPVCPVAAEPITGWDGAGFLALLGQLLSESVECKIIPGP